MAVPCGPREAAAHRTARLEEEDLEQEEDREEEVYDNEKEEHYNSENLNDQQKMHSDTGSSSDNDEKSSYRNYFHAISHFAFTLNEK